MNHRHKISDKSSIYHYRLIAKLHFSEKMIYCYYALIGIIALSTLIFFHPVHIIEIFIAFPLLHLLYIIIIFVSVHTHHRLNLKHWTIQFNWLWHGFLPAQYVRVKSFIRIHIELLLIGTAFIALLYPWTSLAFVITALLVHLWCLIHRLIFLIIAYRRDDDSVIKINEQDISVYKP